jgi:hypothetical protein
VSVRRIALLILTFALVAFATHVVSAAAETPTLAELRTQLRQTRQRLAYARETLTLARGDLTDVQALVTAVGGTPAILTVITDPATADPTTTAADGTTDPTTAGVDAGTSQTLADPVLAALIASLDPSLAVRLLADGVIEERELTAAQDRVVKWRGIVRRLRRAKNALEARIELRLQIAEWNRNGEWRPLIEIAARRNGVSPDGLYRLMMLESSGRRYAGSTYKGLFQYYPGTWRAAWNPWRALGIYNGWAQIRATAYALSKGMGPSQWPNTYPMAF